MLRTTADFNFISGSAHPKFTGVISDESSTVNIMKRRVLFLVMSIISASNGTAAAQTTRGRLLLEELTNIKYGVYGMSPCTTLGWTTYRWKSDPGNAAGSEGDQQFSLDLSPRVGYFVADHLVAGLDATLSYSHFIPSVMDDRSSSTQYALGAFVRYYLTSQKVRPFAEINYSAGYGIHKCGTGNVSEESRYHMRLFGFGIGAAFPLGERVSFNTLAGYQSILTWDKEENEQNERSVAGTIGLKFGVSIIL